MSRTPAVTAESDRLRRRARRLEWATVAWNVGEVGITVSLGIAASSLSLIAFGLDSLVEVFASLVVLWHLRPGSPSPQATGRALRLVAVAFGVLAAYLLVSGARGLLTHHEAEPSPLGVAYLAVTAATMFALARAKRTAGRALGSEPVLAEAAMTTLDGCLAAGILAALAANDLFGWWWADPVAAGAIGIVAVAEAREHWREAGEAQEEVP